MISIPIKKKQHKHLSIETLPDANILYLPMDGYRGRMTPLVERGERVKKHQLLAETQDIFSAKTHAPVSGKIIGTKEINNRSYLLLENDFLEETIPANTLPPEQLTKEDILRIIRDYGIEGGGGARFPTHLKYSVGDRKIETIIINGAECEPYLNSDFAVMYNEPRSILTAIGIVQKVINAQRIVIAVEKHNKELKKKFTELIPESKLPIKVKLLPDEYPQGGELQLIKSVTGMELPKGSIPAHHGVIVSNVGTLRAIFNAFSQAIPHIDRIVTVANEKSRIEAIFKVKIGTPVGHLLRIAGIELYSSDTTVILGGPMMGKIAVSEETPIDKGTGGVIVIQSTKERHFNCIGCGYCVDVCPQRLMPLEFVRYASLGDKKKLAEYRVMDCIECGACAYICPSDVPLMHNILEGKKIINR